MIGSVIEFTQGSSVNNCTGEVKDKVRVYETISLPRPGLGIDKLPVSIDKYLVKTEKGMALVNPLNIVNIIRE